MKTRYTPEKSDAFVLLVPLALMSFALCLGSFLPLPVLIVVTLLSAGYCVERYVGGAEPPELQVDIEKILIVACLNFAMWSMFLLR